MTTNKQDVRRYDDIGSGQICPINNMYESDDGDYVLYADYEALQAECDQLRTMVDARGAEASLEVTGRSDFPGYVICVEINGYGATLGDLLYTASQPTEQQPSADDSLTSVPDEVFAAEFAAWWEEHGQFCRAGGGIYERTFAFEAWRHLYPQLMNLQMAAFGEQP